MKTISLLRIPVNFLILLLLPVKPLIAQTLHNPAALFISEGMEVHLGDGLINTGFIQNNGSIALTGDWTSQDTYQGSGVINLVGKDQTLFNNNQPFEKLVIDGGGNKTIRNKLIINKTIEFVNGIVRITDADTLLLNASCIVNGGSATSYVEGALITKGSGYKFYPIGKSGNYRPAELVNIKGANPVIELEVFENAPAITTDLPATIDQTIYWSRKTLEGTFTGSAIALAYGQSISSRTIIAEAENFSESFSILGDLSSQFADNVTWLNSSSEITKSIIVIGELTNEPPRPYYLSTTLSPHAADPDNRAIRIFGDEVSNGSFYFQVFNRWGVSIFESKSYAEMASTGWDGKQQGTALPSGVYPYSIKYVDQAGKATQHTGFITIIN